MARLVRALVAHPEPFFDLGFEFGYPKLFHRFASKVCKERGLVPNVVHIDAGHDYGSVMADLTAWWPLISASGVLIADDYFPEGEGWPEVLTAVDDFFAKHRHASFESSAGKALIRKYADED